MSYGKARDFGPGHKAPKTPVGDTYTRDLLQMLEWNDAYRKSDEFQRFEADRVRRESLAQVATPVVQRQVAQGVIQRQEKSLQQILESYESAYQEYLVESSRSGPAGSLATPTRRRLRDRLHTQEFLVFEEGADAVDPTREVWTGIVDAFFDTFDLVRTIAALRESVLPSESGPTGEEYRDVQDDIQQRKAEAAAPLIAFLADKPAAFQAGFLVTLENYRSVGALVAFVAEALAGPLVMRGLGFAEQVGGIVFRRAAQASRARRVAIRLQELYKVRQLRLLRAAHTDIAQAIRLEHPNLTVANSMKAVTGPPGTRPKLIPRGDSLTADLEFLNARGEVIMTREVKALVGEVDTFMKELKKGVMQVRNEGNVFVQVNANSNVERWVGTFVRSRLSRGSSISPYARATLELWDDTGRLLYYGRLADWVEFGL